MCRMKNVVRDTFVVWRCHRRRVTFEWRAKGLVEEAFFVTRTGLVGSVTIRIS